VKRSSHAVPLGRVLIGSCVGDRREIGVAGGTARPGRAKTASLLSCLLIIETGPRGQSRGPVRQPVMREPPASFMRFARW
ncbi:unnamed protein product, partial [Acidocella sp. C78]